NALVVVEVPRVHRRAGAMRNVLKTDTPAIQLARRIPQNRVQPEQRSQRPVAITRVTGRLVQARKEQSGERVGLRGFALFGVTSTGVPPEAAPERIVPEIAAA